MSVKRKGGWSKRGSFTVLHYTVFVSFSFLRGALFLSLNVQRQKFNFCFHLIFFIFISF
jgi:hypothetical protein